MANVRQSSEGKPTKLQNDIPELDATDPPTRAELDFEHAQTKHRRTDGMGALVPDDMQDDKQAHPQAEDRHRSRKGHSRAAEQQREEKRDNRVNQEYRQDSDRGEEDCLFFAGDFPATRTIGSRFPTPDEKGLFPGRF